MILYNIEIVIYEGEASLPFDVTDVLDVFFLLFSLNYVF